MSMMKVLVAEDDLTMVHLLKTLLKMEGFEVASLDADDNVTEAVKDNCPDVLLMDVHLLHQNGLDVLDSLRALGHNCKTRIVMTSGSNLESECMQHGADGFLLKPFMPDDLVRALKGLN